MSVVLRAQDNIVRSTEFSTEIYLNDIPPFVEGELERLYSHVQSSFPYIRIFRMADQLHTYVARRGETPTVILLFRLGKRNVEVLNRMMQIDQIELQRFAACVFEQFPSVGVISFKAVHADLVNLPYPLQRNHAMEDMSITLPDTQDSYAASLGKSTRSNLKYYMAKLKKSFSSVSVQSYEKEAIDEQLIHTLVKLSEAKIMAKGVNFSLNKEYQQGMLEMIKICGVLTVIWVDGNLCAGAISYRTGSSQYTEVIAHDSKYNAYSPGMLCFYQAIYDSIAKGVKKYHLGGGEYDYKVRLLGVRQNMEQVDIYRSVEGMVLNGDLVLKVWFNARILQLKTWLRKHENSLPVRALLESRIVVRKVMKGG